MISADDPTDAAAEPLPAAKRVVANSKPIPTHKLPMPHTTISVDSFSWNNPDVTAQVLTHFHADHYQGLSRVNLRTKVVSQTSSKVTRYIVLDPQQGFWNSS